MSRINYNTTPLVMARRPGKPDNPLVASRQKRALGGRQRGRIVAALEQMAVDVSIVIMIDEWPRRSCTTLGANLEAAGGDAD